MANIVELKQWRQDQSQYQRHWFQQTLRVPAGIDNESDVLKVVLAKSLKTYITTETELWESLSSEQEIIEDTARWSLVSTGESELYPLSRGASFLKIINKSAISEAILDVTGV